MSSDKPTEEGIIRATLSWSGISVAFRSRAVSAFDRLIGALVGIPVAWLETVERRIRNRTSRELFVQDAAAARLGTAILEDDEVTRSVADLALSSRVLPTFGKVGLSDLAINEHSPKPADPQSHVAEIGEEGVDQD